MSVRYPRVLGLRVSDEDLKKLDVLSKQSFRQRGDLLRALIHSATALDNLGLAFMPPAIQEDSGDLGEDKEATPANAASEHDVGDVPEPWLAPRLGPITPG
jgi:hypothetical protein